MKLGLLVLLISFTQITHAKIVARVLDVKGNAFSFYGKKAVTLKYGSKLTDLSEVMVEDGSTLSLVNSKGHIFHVNGGSLVKLFDGIMELKNGHVWVQSNNKQGGLINTSNSVGVFDEGEFIYSFDNISGKTQLLVLTGEVKFSNAIEPELRTNIASGYFSLIDPKYENGIPRGATKVGLQSYKEMKSVFAHFDKLQNTNFEHLLWGEKKESSSMGRGIASVPQSSTSSKKGRLITIKTYKSSGRIPASVGDSPLQYYNDLKKKDAWKYKPVQNSKTAPVNYFGYTPSKRHTVSVKPNRVKAGKVVVIPAKKQTKKYSDRAPASIKKLNLINDLKKSGFESSLEIESGKIKRNPEEVNHLIDELKSYSKDYQKEY